MTIRFYFCDDCRQEFSIVMCKDFDKVMCPYCYESKHLSRLRKGKEET